MFHDIKKIIPHRSPFVMIDAYQKIDIDHAVAWKTFHPGEYGLHHGKVMEGLLIECVAQATAAHLGYQSLMEEKGKGKDENGMLVMVDAFEFNDTVKEGDTISVHIKKTNEVGSFKIYHGQILKKNINVAQGGIKLFIEGQV